MTNPEYSRVQEYYEFEKQLATQLRQASKENRRRLYDELYDELFPTIPMHLLTKKADPQANKRDIEDQLQVLKRFLSPSTTYLEIGLGDCALALEVTGHVKQVYTVDVSTELTRLAAALSNLELIISDRTSVPVPPCSVDIVAYKASRGPEATPGI